MSPIQQRHFYDFLSPNNIRCRVRAGNRDELLSVLLDMLKRHHPDLDREFAAEEIRKREELFPSVIAPGLVVPHTRIPGLSTPLVGVACVPDGVDYGEDFGIVKIAVVLLTPPDEPNLHMQVLAALAADFGEPGLIDELAAVRTPAEAIARMRRNGSAMPAFLKAADLMDNSTPPLQESDTLRQAIAVFAATGAEELVVTDRVGDLRGVLALSDLLQFSLPEHLLWLEDLTPIDRFQPFSEMLRTADETRVADVMREEFLRVDAGVPAIQLAKLFLVHRVRQLVITGSDGKLAGVVDLKRFSAKLFWE